MRRRGALKRSAERRLLARPPCVKGAARHGRAGGLDHPYHLPGGSGSAHSAGTRNAAPGRRRENPHSVWGTVGPTISFLQKETVPPGGTREKSSGPGSWSSYLKPKRAPTPHKVFREAPSPSRVGVQGPIRASSRAVGFGAPGAFLLDRQAARSLFPGEKRMGGRRRFPLGKKKVRPLAAKIG